MEYLESFSAFLDIVLQPAKPAKKAGARALKSLMRSYGIKQDAVNGGYYARYDDEDWEFVGRNLDEVQDWLAEQGEEAVCA